MELRLPELPILKGEFEVYVFLFDEQGLHVYDQAVVHRAFTVETTEEYKVGLIQVEHSWGRGTPRPGTAETASPVTA